MKEKLQEVLEELRLIKLKWLLVVHFIEDWDNPDVHYCEGRCWVIQKFRGSLGEQEWYWKLADS